MQTTTCFLQNHLNTQKVLGLFLWGSVALLLAYTATAGCRDMIYTRITSAHYLSGYSRVLTNYNPHAGIKPSTGFYLLNERTAHLLSKGRNDHSTKQTIHPRKIQQNALK
jgi:hypothetical protein